VPAAAGRVIDPDPAPTGPSNEPPRPLEGLRVLFVDDDVRMRDMITTMLEQAGARVTGCANGAEALDALQQGVPDVVVMDINLPGPSGFSVMRKIRHLDDPAARVVPAIALSGYGDELGLTPMLDAGFTDYLGKPIRMDRFLRAVERAAKRVL
jgi:CheY-like chemotaxis protein